MGKGLIYSLIFGGGNGSALTPTQLANLMQGDDFISVDENEQGTKVIVSIDANYKPWVVETEGSSGTFTDSEFAQLTSSDVAKIVNDDEYYFKADVQEGFMVFIHNGRDNQQQIYSKAIYVYTDSEGIGYKTWTKVSTNMSVLPYVTTAPTAANTDGLRIAVLTTEPATKYNGWIYIITEA